MNTGIMLQHALVLVVLLLPESAAFTLVGLRSQRIARQHYSMTLSADDQPAEDDDGSLAELNRRIASMQTTEATVQCIVLDAMVPRQRLPLQIGPPFVEAFTEAQATGRPLCMLGIDAASQTVMKRGVEARIESLTKVTTMTGFFECSLIGGRRFELLEADTLSSQWPPVERLFSAKVRWLDEPLPGDEETVARAQGLEPLVAEWTKLVVSTGREREPGQIERLLGDLGPMPEAESPDDRALYVAALIK